MERDTFNTRCRVLFSLGRSARCFVATEHGGSHPGRSVRAAITSVGDGVALRNIRFPGGFACHGAELSPGSSLAANPLSDRRVFVMLTR